MGLGILNAVGGVLKGAVGIGQSVVDGRNRVREAKIEAKVARWEAISNLKEKMVQGNIDYDLEALKQSQFSWKDEYLIVVLFTPVIMAFVPGLRPYAEAGFDCIESMPVWYQASVLGIIAAVFGLRGFFSKYLNAKNIFGGKKNG
jgi:hypothetical protein